MPSKSKIILLHGHENKEFSGSLYRIAELNKTCRQPYYHLRNTNTGRSIYIYERNTKVLKVRVGGGSSES